jgi:DNA-binding response OmpR family regulator
VEIGVRVLCIVRVARHQEEREDAVVQRRNKSVLCIGNDPLSLNLRCALLKEHGWNVFSSGSGYEGIIRFGQETVDAVVVDLNDDGAEAALIAGELKRLRPGVPVVILVPDGHALVNGATQQANAVIVKSQETHVLIDTLRALLPDEKSAQ